MDVGGGGDELGGFGGANVEQGGGGFGVGVDGGAAGDMARIDRCGGFMGILRAEIWARARLRRKIGLGVPASDQEWPPGPVMVTRKRRLPRARVTTAELPLPSRAIAAAMRLR